MSIIEIVIRPVNRTGLYRAYLGESLICEVRQPYLKAARILLERGYPADLLITMRHQGKAYRSFNPAPLGEVAGLHVRETEMEGPLFVRHKPWSASEINPAKVAA